MNNSYHELTDPPFNVILNAPVPSKAPPKEGLNWIVTALVVLIVQIVGYYIGYIKGFDAGLKEAVDTPTNFAFRPIEPMMNDYTVVDQYTERDDSDAMLDNIPTLEVGAVENGDKTNTFDVDELKPELPEDKKIDHTLSQNIDSPDNKINSNIAVNLEELEIEGATDSLEKTNNVQEVKSDKLAESALESGIAKERQQAFVTPRELDADSIVAAVKERESGGPNKDLEMRLEPVRSASNLAVGFYVQVSAAANRSEANTIMKKLRSSGFPAVVEESKTTSGKLIYYRVLVGPEQDKRLAERLSSQVAREPFIKARPFVRTVE